MNEIYLRTLELLDCSLHDKDDFVMDASLWPEIFKELEAQTVTCLVAKSINKLNLSPEDKFVFMQRIGMSFQYFRLVGEEQRRIFEILNEKNIPVVVLKGFAAAMYYPTPEHRTMGDIDLIFPRDKFQEAISLLNNSGYKQIGTLEDNSRHAEFETPSGITIEPHYQFSSSNNKEFNERLDVIVEDGVLRAESVNVCGYDITVLPRIENGMVLLTHINQHLEGGLGLRQIIDWMLFVENCLDDEIWMNEFASKAESIGLKKLAMVTTAACKKYLGLKSNITWADEYVDAKIADEFMKYVMDHGNFGRKNRVETRSTSIMRLSKNPFTFFKTAQDYGTRNWDVVKKYPVLKIFAWVYQIIKWIRLGLKMGINTNDIKHISDKEKNETKFLNELRCY